MVPKNPLLRLGRGLLSLVFTLVRIPLAFAVLVLFLPGYLVSMITPVAAFPPCRGSADTVRGLGAP